jgi:hypothetical protein
MRIAGKFAVIISILAVLFVISPVVNAYAGCSATRFVIEDEISGQEIGLIYTDTSAFTGNASDICIEGEFMGTRYQYLYLCEKSERFKFIKKFRSLQKGCKWGVIH